MTGRYPPGHGARDNGMRVSTTVPTLATELKAHGFRTAAFVAAFPLDHQFGLDRGFDVYGDRLPRGRRRPPRQRTPGIAGRRRGDRVAAHRRPTCPTCPQPLAPSPDRVLPVGPPLRAARAVRRSRPIAGRCSIATTRRSRPPIASWPAARRRSARAATRSSSSPAITARRSASTASSAHSIFVYDTTLRVPLVMRGPGVPARRCDRAGVTDPVTLADVAPTAMRLLGFTMPDADGIDLSPALAGAALPRRELYAESFAPLVEFGWAPLRAIRSGRGSSSRRRSPSCSTSSRTPASRPTSSARSTTRRARRSMRARDRLLAAARCRRRASIDASGRGAPARARLHAHGFDGIEQSSRGRAPDPKDRRELAARIAQVTSGELQGAALVDALEGDPARRSAATARRTCVSATSCCRPATARAPSRSSRAAISGGLPRRTRISGSPPAWAGAATWPAPSGRSNEARRLEPDNPVVDREPRHPAGRKGNLPGAIESLQRGARRSIPTCTRRASISRSRTPRPAAGPRPPRPRATCSARLPPNAPQRAEVERLLRAVQ